MPTPEGTVRYRLIVASSLAAGAVACRPARAACAFSLSTSASGRPPALILALSSSASFFQSARVSFSFASRVISIALLLFCCRTRP